MAILKSDKQNHFCSFPWNGLQIHVSGQVRPCCMIDDLGIKYQSGVDLRKSLAEKPLEMVREQMLRGEAPRPCRACYEEDQMGVQSVRLYSPAIDTENLSSVKISRAEISLTNRCNLDCVMCRPQFSSRVQKLYQDFASTHPLQERIDFPSFTVPPEDVPGLVEQVCEAKEIRLIGGEPLLTEAGRLFIKLWAQGQYPGRLEVITNGTFLDDAILSDLASCQNKQVDMSVDGVGEIYSWIRGHSWQHIQEQILKTQAQVPLRLIPTLQVYNLFNLPLLADFCQKNKIRLLLGHILRHPHFLSAWAWPKSLRQQLSLDYGSLWGTDHADLIGFLQKDGEYTEDMRQRFLSWTHFLNKKRGKDWFALEPQAKDFLLKKI